MAISPLATPRTSVPCTTLAIYAPVARLTSLTYSAHYCCDCHKYFNIDLSDLAPPGSHYTNRVIDLAVRVVVEDGLP